ncbi:hypothetical protein [Moraxella lacunata]|uniref:hypothetical protein n=1 Tax=Moraxella lacunata TaxID=477 RepID=UPI003EE19BE0
MSFNIAIFIGTHSTPPHPNIIAFVVILKFLGCKNFLIYHPSKSPQIKSASTG